MMILTIRTDKPESQIGLFENDLQLAYESWEAHRQLAETIHQKIKSLLESNNKKWNDVDGIVCFQGPGSFTGLRIGLTVGNALAYGLSVPIMATQGEDWIRNGVEHLLAGKNDQLALPEYGAPVHITPPKH